MRERSAAAHAQLEATPLMQAFSSGAPTQRAYADYLRRQFDLHVVLEAALKMWVPPEWVSQRLVKAQWLQSDLRALGLDTDARPVECPAIRSQGAAFGVLYVLEGSTLGLQMVRHRFQQAHPALDTAGRFLQGYGTDTGRQWRSFVERLETLPAEAWPEALVASSAAFATFHQLFSEPGDE
jgi:heme oxygenase